MQSLLTFNHVDRSDEQPAERGIAIAVVRKGTDRSSIDEYLDELEQLCATAGAEIVLRIVQERDRFDPATLLGKGKLAELLQFVRDYAVQFVIFDEGLSPVQVRNLQTALGVKVLDRSMIILDIFAKHARTLEAKTQVELAQLQYLYPRLTRLWTHLSRQYGGIGTRGPGETQIETDRRLIKERIAHLKQRLFDIERQRAVQRSERKDSFRFALVGYTNAGKSTLFNQLTNATVRAEDKLFATLDTTVRRCQLPSGRKVLLSDTVGFIRKLPAHLVASFKSTLAEAVESDVLLHVADATHPALDHQIETVTETLATLGIEQKPHLLLLNKVDALSDRDARHQLAYRYPNALLISARTCYNIHSLLLRMEEYLLSACMRMRVHVPYHAMRELAYIYANATVEHRTDADEGITIEFLVPRAQAGQLLSLVEPFAPSVEYSLEQS
ncbi:MAG: GTPase HflX [Candidatus Kapaibacterium sp.]|nr:MAG: GTPase HflX [Candidatus Kapabacteria bacterium]